LSTTTATVFLRPTFGTGGGGGAVVFFPFRSVSGLYSAINSGGAGVRRKDWKPDRNSAWFDKEGRPSVQFVKFIDYIADKVLGGSNNKTLPEVESLITYSQAQSLFTDLFSQAIQAQTNANAQALDAMKQVLIAAAVPGTAQIPPVQLQPVDVTPPPYIPPDIGSAGGGGGGD
jgi:hypothetical protein